jgi:hypothetical protein
MKRHRDRRSLERVPRARRTPRLATGLVSRPGRVDRRGAGGVADESALALLSDVLIGDSHWTMPEIRRLITMRELAERGRWHVEGQDGGASSS